MEWAGIADVNNNKPVFDQCQEYSALASVPEGKHDNYSIIQVRELTQNMKQLTWSGHL